MHDYAKSLRKSSYLLRATLKSNKDCIGSKKYSKQKYRTFIKGSPTKIRIIFNYLEIHMANMHTFSTMLAKRIMCYL